MKKEKTIVEEKVEREYVIPLREKVRVVPRYKKTNKAIKTIKEFLVRHMKIRDRDLKKIKLNRFVNEMVWNRGIKKPPIKIKVKAIREGEIVKVSLLDMPRKLKLREEREKKFKQGLETKPKKETEKIKEDVKKELDENKKEEKVLIEESKNIKVDKTPKRSAPKVVKSKRPQRKVLNK